MNKVQSAISQVLTTTAVGVGLAKGYQEQQEKKQREILKEKEIASREAEKNAKAEEKEKEAKAKEEEAKAKEKAKADALQQKQDEEAIDVAKRVALKRLNVPDNQAEALLLAEKMGTLNPRTRVRDEKGKVLFHAGTMARRMADMSLAGATYNKATTDASYRQRILSMGKTQKERVKNVLIAEKGGKV